MLRLWQDSLKLERLGCGGVPPVAQGACEVKPFIRMSLLVCCLGACSKENTDSAPSAQPLREKTQPKKVDSVVEAEERAEAEQVTPEAPLYGQPLPKQAVRLLIDEEGRTTLGEKIVKMSTPQEREWLSGGRGWLISAHPEVYMAQLRPLWAALDDAKAEVWLEHRESGRAFRVELQDEQAFKTWLEAAVPGRVRVIQRGDGLELSTVFGKLPGFDPQGPSVPNQKGRVDVGSARTGLMSLRRRFKAADEIYFVPSNGTELTQVMEALSANFQGPDEPLFPKVSLVYQRLASPSRP